MRLVEVSFGAAQPVDAYGPGHWRTGGTVIRGPMLITATGAMSWGGYDDLAPVLALAGAVDVVLVGTGRTIAHPPAAFRAALEGAALGLEAMDSAAAARTYNVLLAEGRRIAAALLPAG
ncbi:MAG: Mth938-like domain-containing protein [Rhodobacteraceae bacterium]|nr:Mth938-like domain-containing protein [Paracoccaceae bacterium]